MPLSKALWLPVTQALFRERCTLAPLR